MSITQASANPPAGDNTLLPVHQPGILPITAEMIASQSNLEDAGGDASVAQVGEGGDAGGAMIEANAPGAAQHEGMANSKESTPMGLLNTIGRFNNTKPDYKLINEIGPAHQKLFTVNLMFDGKEYQGTGTSIKRAQHAAAQKALESSTLPHPEPRHRAGSFKTLKSLNQGAFTSTVELNSLALKSGVKVRYQVLNPFPQFSHGGYQKKKKPMEKENQQNGLGDGQLGGPGMNQFGGGQTPGQLGGQSSDQLGGPGSGPFGRPPQTGPPSMQQQPLSQTGDLEDGVQGIGGPPFGPRMPGQQESRMRGPRGSHPMGYYPPMGFQQPFGRYPMYRPRYRRPYPPVFCVKLTVEDREFIGQGPNQRAARQDAATKAMKSLAENPIPEKKDKSTSMVDGEPEVESLPSAAGEDGGSSKSEISQVYEIANFNGLTLEFKVLDESGPPHLKSYKVECTVGNISVEESGTSKKEAKRKAAAAVLPKLKSLPPPEKSIRQPRPGFNKPFFQKKRNPNIKKSVEDADFGSPGMDPISRLVQICQGKKLKDPLFEVLHDQPIPDRSKGRGTIYRHIFTVQVSCNDQKAEGKGATKKEAKKEAAEALLKDMGYNPTPPSEPSMCVPGLDATPSKPAIKLEGQDNKDDEIGSGDRKVTFKDDNDKAGKTGSDITAPDPIPGSQQQGPPIPGITPGLFPMMPGVKAAPRFPTAQVPPPSQGLNRAPGAPVTGMPLPRKNFNAVLAADIAQELLLTKRSVSAENLVPAGGARPISTRPRHLLEYLGAVTNLEVKFADFPQTNKPEHLSLVSISTDPPISIHGSGPSIDASHDLASLNILRALAGYTADDLGSGRVGQA